MANGRDDVTSLRERAKRLLTLDHFAILGVSRTATTEEVQRAFLEAVKTWHPDRVPAGASELAPLFSRVFGRLEVARGTLLDAARRARYVEELERAPRGGDAAADPALAEASVEAKKAEAYLKKNDLAAAERHLRRAVRLAPANATYQALLLWLGVTPTTSKEELTRIAGELGRLIEGDPTCERAFFFRGQIRRRLGSDDAAHEDFLVASELAPGNIDAQREIRVYKMRRERSSAGQRVEAAGDGGVAGFFRKLFKR